MTDTETRATGHISTIGWIVLAMAMLSLSVVLWTSYHDRQQTECQQQVNAAFFNTSRDRAELADADRNALRTLIAGIQTATTDREYAALFKEYDETSNEIDRRRDKLTFPSAEDICEP